jgi:hypothetical protein
VLLVVEERGGMKMEAISAVRPDQIRKVIGNNNNTRDPTTARREFPRVTK